MRKLLFALSLFAVVSYTSAQDFGDLSELPSSYIINGSLSVSEVTDTVGMQFLHKAPRYIIKKSEEFTYIAIRSNSGTILNAYLIDDQKIMILHASAALGQINMNYVDGVYKAEKTEFDWIYRDPNIWDEKHPEGVDNIQEFYSQFGWTANTWTLGSYREFEMVIHNSLFSEDAELVISYTSMEDRERNIQFKKELEDSQLSGDIEIDNQIHNGYIPEEIELEK